LKLGYPALEKWRWSYIGKWELCYKRHPNTLFGLFMEINHWTFRLLLF